MALGEQFVQCVPAPLPRLHDETPALHSDTDLSARLQLQNIEQGGRDGQHDRTADLPQIRGVHGLFLKNYISV
jgi:hypothetical protein